MSKRSKAREREARLEAIYARLPTIACQRRCGEACGPILLSVAEADRIRRAVHETPRTNGLPAGQTRCGFLTAEGRCRIYQLRPLICRVWGLAKRLSCMFGCVPSRWLTDAEFVALAEEVEALAGGDILMSTAEGLYSVGDSFRSLRARTLEAPGAPPLDVVEHYAEMTRGLRVLHRGRIMGVVPTNRTTP